MATCKNGDRSITLKSSRMFEWQYSYETMKINIYDMHTVT